MLSKNVIHITHTDPFKDTRILNICESIGDINKDYYQFIIGLSKKGSQIKNYRNKKIITLKLITSLLPSYFKIIKKFFLIIEFNIKILIKCILIKPKVIHCHDLSGLYIGIIIKLIYKSKFIFDAHELEAQEGFVSPIEHVFRTIYEFFPILFCDNLITVSNSIALWYKWKGAKNVTVIFNKPKLCTVNLTSKKTLLEKLPPINKGKNIIFIGTLVKERSIEVLLNQFKNNNKFNLYFLGEGPLEKIIKKEMNNSKNIYLHRFVDKDEVTNFIKGFDYSICMNEQTSLSNYFSMPNKLFQSLASGIPVIVSNNPDAANLITKNEYGLVNKKVKDIFRELEDSFSMIEDFKKNIKRDNKKFSWDYEFNKIKNIYG